MEAKVVTLLMPESHRKMKVTFTPVEDSQYIWVEYGGVGAYCYQIPIPIAERWIKTGVIL